MDAGVLISGASVAGPTLAYWLRRYGFNPTVVERAPALRAGLGGHAVDLFGPSVDVTEWMGVLPKVMASRTKTEVISFVRPGRSSPVDINLGRLIAGISDRHVEIMRGELASILYEASRDDVEYIFGDSIASLHDETDGVSATFDSGSTRRFSLVVGADGLHSNVRRLRFGEESQFRHYLGGYLAAFTLPNYLGLKGRMLTYNAPDKLIGMYPVRQTGEARAAFLFRRDEELDYDYRDVTAQKRLLRQVFATDGWEVPRLVAETANATDFYLDSISQILMPSWSQGRVTLVGDAGYSPGPAVGGGTSVAMVGAYVLADELRESAGDPGTAFLRYERRMRELVQRSRKIAPTMMKTLIPRTNRQIWMTRHLLRLLSRLPGPIQHRVSAMQRGPARAFDSVTLGLHEPSR